MFHKFKTISPPLPLDEVFRFITRYSCLYLFLSFGLSSFSQEIPVQNSFGEEMQGLEVNTKLFGNKKTNSSFQLKNNSSLIYFIDTLALPVIDDFSQNRIKNFNVDTGDANVIRIPKVLFEVNGNYTDSVEIMNDTTWYYQFNTVTLQYDSFPNSPDLFITFYGYNNPDSIGYLTQPSSFDTTWSTITYRFNASDTDTVILERDTVYYNSRDTFYFVPDSAYYIWVDSFAFINYNFGVNPPTVGVATFDGLNALGEPYDFSSSSSYGSADRLTSKPIDLSNLTSDSSVVLSFYFQPMGSADFPDLEDSLVLEFYSPADSLWIWQWSTPGITTAQASQVPVFQLVKMAVSGSEFLKKGFRFRFRNYATLSGMHDIWNIDYVYLDKNRDINSNSVNDIGFVSIGNSFVNAYTSMPMKAFKGNASLYMVPDFMVKMTNLENSTQAKDSIRYFVSDENESVLFKESVSLQRSFSPQGQQTIYHSVYNSPNYFQFLPSDSEKVVFKVKFVSEESATDLCMFNDTVTHFQVFDSYFSYDDGSAEQTYSLVPQLSVPGPKLAYKFSTNIQDSLRGVFLYFPYFLSDVSQLSFIITVWSDNNGTPGNILYQSSVPSFPNYSDRINEYNRYEIDPPFALTGSYFIGWQQAQAQTQTERIRLGFDKNINNQNKIFFNTNGTWYNSSQAGSLMIRPDFGQPGPITFATQADKKNSKFCFFPNPASEKIHFFSSPGGWDFSDQPVKITIFNSLGSAIFQEVAKNSHTSFTITIDISAIPAGIYFLKTEEELSGGSSIEKLLIAR